MSPTDVIQTQEAALICTIHIFHIFFRIMFGLVSFVTGIIVLTEPLIIIKPIISVMYYGLFTTSSRSRQGIGNTSSFTVHCSTTLVQFMLRQNRLHSEPGGNIIACLSHLFQTCKGTITRLQPCLPFSISPIF